MGADLGSVLDRLLVGPLASVVLMGLGVGISGGVTLLLRDRTLRRSVQLQNTFRQPSDESSNTPWRDQAQQRLWFVYSQRLGWVLLCSWILNILFLIGRHPLHPTGSGMLGGSLWEWLSMVLQLCSTLAIAAICYGLSYPVARSVGQLDFTRNQFLTFTLLPWVGRILCFSSVWNALQVLIALSMFWTLANIELGMNQYLGERELALLANPPTNLIGPSLSIAFLSLLANRVLQWLAVRALKGHPQTLLEGEFRDRTFQLAKQAGVKLENLYVLPTPFLPMANAFALPSKRILVTDRLLTLLRKQEVDAVIAHELGHLRHQHLGLVFSIGLVLPCLFGVMVAVSPGAGLNHMFLLLILLLTMPMLWAWLRHLRHKIEYDADRHSAKLIQEPKALIVGLARIMRFNPFIEPARALEQSSSTHPSVMQRVQALAKQSQQVYAELVQEVITQANTPVPAADRYDLPEMVQNPSRVWSSDDKTFVRVVQQWTMIAALILPAVGVVWGFNAIAQGWVRSLEYPVALLVTGIACFMVSDRVSHLGLGHLRTRLAQQWIEAGYSSQFSYGQFHGKFVTLSPDVQPHLYEDLWFWDIGFLRIWGDRLYYFGAQTQFCLTRDQIVHLRLGLAEPNGWRSPALSVGWVDLDRQTKGTFRIEIRDLNLRDGIIATRRWKTQLEQWHQRSHVEESTPLLPSFGPPDARTLTRTRPNKSVVGKRLAHLLAQVWIVGWVFCTLAHLPWLETLYVCFVGMLGAIALRLPEAIAARPIPSKLL